MQVPACLHAYGCAEENNAGHGHSSHAAIPHLTWSGCAGSCKDSARLGFAAPPSSAPPGAAPAALATLQCSGASTDGAAPPGLPAVPGAGPAAAASAAAAAPCDGDGSAANGHSPSPRLPVARVCRVSGCSQVTQGDASACALVARSVSRSKRAQAHAPRAALRLPLTAGESRLAPALSRLRLSALVTQSRRRRRGAGPDRLQVAI